MLSRKYYNKIAEILRKHHINHVTHYLEFSFEEMIDDFMKFFKEDNPEFSEEKFHDFIYRWEL